MPSTREPSTRVDTAAAELMGSVLLNLAHKHAVRKKCRSTHNHPHACHHIQDRAQKGASFVFTSYMQDVSLMPWGGEKIHGTARCACACPPPFSSAQSFLLHPSPPSVLFSIPLSRPFHPSLHKCPLSSGTGPRQAHRVDLHTHRRRRPYEGAGTARTPLTDLPAYPIRQ